ncbi:MAG TPA: hypothetical protein VGK77_14930 [Candidatus Binatia bacterium]|jgi:negative regulator of replication initiation
MKTIRISDEVWNAIAAVGRFGETEDHVLRRVFKIPAQTQNHRQTTSERRVDESDRPFGWKERRANDRMTQAVNGNKLILQFDSGPKFEKPLPAKDDYAAVRELRDKAVEFVRSNGGTKGQQHAAIRALTSRGYHVTVKRDHERIFV